jgi:hypothetical protein
MLKWLGIALWVVGLFVLYGVVTKLSAPRPRPRIIVQWDFSAPGMAAPARFQVERTEGEGHPWRVVGDVAPTARTWIDQTVQPEITYCYRVSALSGTAGVASSPPSDVACDKIPPSVPRSPDSQ